MASSMHQTFSGDVKSLRKYQCEICLYASSRKYDVKKHQERMHKNAKNAISKIGSTKRGQVSPEDTESEDDEGDSEDDDDDDEYNSYGNCLRLFKEFTNFIDPWYNDYVKYCENIKHDDQEDRKEIIVDCIKHYVKLKYKLINICELSMEELDYENDEDAMEEEDSDDTDEEAEEEMEDSEEKGNHQDACCLTNFLLDFEEAFENNKWAKNKLSKIEEKEKLEIEKIKLDEEINYEKRNEGDDDSDDDEKEEEEKAMSEKEENKLLADNEKLKECVIKLRKAVKCYEDENKPSNYFKPSSTCNNDTIRLIGFACNKYMRRIREKDFSLIEIGDCFDDIADTQVSIRRKRLLLEEPQVGHGIMMRIKDSVLPQILKDLAN